MVLELAYHFIWQRRNGSELALLSRRGVRDKRRKVTGDAAKARDMGRYGELRPRLSQDPEGRACVSHLCLVG